MEVESPNQKLFLTVLIQIKRKNSRKGHFFVPEIDPVPSPYHQQNLKTLLTLSGYKNSRGQNFWNLIFFHLKRQSYRYYHEKNQVGPTSSAHLNLTMKLLTISKNSPKNRTKMKFYIFFGSRISVLLQISSSSFQAS